MTYKKSWAIRTISCCLALTIVSAARSSPVAASSLSTTTLISTGLQGGGANAHIEQSGISALSDDGRIVVFASAATNIIPGDTNGFSDVFAYDRITKKTERISQTSTGGQADGNSFTPTVSGDGRYVAYPTQAQNILTDPHMRCTPACMNIAVYDRVTKLAKPANLNTLGLRQPVALNIFDLPWPVIISGDGRFVLFESAHAVFGPASILVRDLTANVTRLASNDYMDNLVIPDGRRYDISDDGRYVVFMTRVGLLPEDKNDADDVYIHDMQLNTTNLVSVNSNGQPNPNRRDWSYEPVISGDGRYVAYMSLAANITTPERTTYTNAYLRELSTGKTTQISKAVYAKPNDLLYALSINKDGRYIAFMSPASNLVPADTNKTFDTFIYYRDYGITRRLSVQSHNGAPAEGGGSVSPSISADGKAVVFRSRAANLTPTPVDPFKENLYMAYNPVVDIPYYDPIDIILRP